MCWMSCDNDMSAQMLSASLCVELRVTISLLAEIFDATTNWAEAGRGRVG
jgi:hypothetical protein